MTSRPPDVRAQALRLMWAALEGRRGALWAGAAWLLLAAGLEAAGPLLGKAFIDRHLVPREGSLEVMAGLLAGAWAAGVAASAIRYLQLRRLADVAMGAVQRLREQAFGHVMALPMPFFDRSMSGQLISRITNDTEAVKQLYLQVMFVMLDSGIVLCGLFAAMVWLDPRLAGVVALLLPAVIGIVWVYQRWSAPAVARTRALRGDLNAQTAESIAGMAVLQATGATAAFGERYARTNEAHFEARCQELRANAWLLRPALDFLNVALLAGVLAAFGLRHAMPGSEGGLQAVEVGLLYAFVSYISRVVEPLIQITMQFSQLQQAMTAAARVDGLLREAPDAASAAIDTGQARAVVATMPAAVCFEAVHFAYGEGPPVIRGVSLSVEPGQFVGLVGATGSGKTSLLQLLLRFYAPQAGSIALDGRPLAAWPEAEFRDQVALVPQEPFLVAGSVRENIDFGRGLDASRLHAAVHDAHLLDTVDRLPQGLDTSLGEGGARLSVGERQLVALARALAGQPRLLLLDEATAHIDAATEQRIQQALAALHERVTVIAIAHRLSTLREADRILVLHHGRIAESGTHEALLAQTGGLYRRLHELQALQWAAG